MFWSKELEIILKRLEQVKMEEEINNFVMNELWNIVSSKDSSDKRLNLIVETISKFFGIDKCSLMVEKDGKFKIIASVGINRKVIDIAEVEAGKGIAGMAVKEKKAIFIRKVNIVGHQELWNEYKTDNFISYPIESNGKIIGVLNLTDKRDSRGFSERDVEAIAPIIERVRFVLEQCIGENKCFI